MPIPVLGVIAPPPTPPIDDGGKPDTTGNARSVITWTTAQGVPMPLTGDISSDNSGVIVQPGLKGFDSPPITLVLDEMPSQDGSAFRSKRSPTRELFIPLFLWAPDRAQYLMLRRSLINAMSPDMGIGTLCVEEPSMGTKRFIRCYLSDGMEGDDTQSLSNGYTYGSYGVVLHAPDPYWYGSPLAEVMALSTTPPINFYTGKSRGAVDESTGPFIVPGLHLSSTYIPSGNRTLTITGGVNSWPVWKVESSGATSFTLWNKTSDKKLILNHAFAAGDTVTIDSRPGHKTAISQNSGNVYSELGPDPQFWPLLAGVNTVEVNLQGGGLGVNGTVTLTYEPRYRGT